MDYLERHYAALARVQRFAQEHPLLWQGLCERHNERDVIAQLCDRRRRRLARRFPAG